MIARLKGTLVSRDGTRAVIDVRDVGYAVIGPSKDIDAWVHAGGDVVIHVSTDVREDAITLYGFADDTERIAFERLRAVNGVGPKVALSSLDTLGLGGLAEAVAADDVRRLCKIPGVGKKLAQRLALELKGKLPLAISTSPVEATPPPSVDAPDKLVLALGQWGYSRAEIQRALAALESMGIGEDKPLPERLSAALRALSSK